MSPPHQRPLTALAFSLAVLVARGTPASAGCVKAVVGGDNHVLALMEDARVFAWGVNDEAQLGNGTRGASTWVPSQVIGLSDVASIGNTSEGENHGIVLKKDGTVWGWGRGLEGQLGFGDPVDVILAPIEAVGLPTIVAIAGHDNWSQALASDGTLWSFGQNDHGQLGDWTTKDSHVPIKQTYISGIKAITGGAGPYALVLLSDGSLWGWGQNGAGQLGNGNQTDQPLPVHVTGMGPGERVMTSVSCGLGHCVALDSTGAAWAWGGNAWGNLGNGSTTLSTVPVAVNFISNVKSVVVGQLHTVALLSDGSVWTWGDNQYGQLGDGTFNDSHVPIQVPGIANAVWVAAGDEFTIAILADGTLWMWGLNADGQLGTDPAVTPQSNVPIQVNLGATDPLPPDQGNVLRAVKRGPDVSLDFTNAPATAWRMFRDPLKTQLGTTALVPDAAVTSFLDPGVVPLPPALLFYRLKGLSPCSFTPGP